MATDDTRARRGRRRKTRRRRAVTAAAGLVIIASGGTAAAAAVNGGSPRWQLETIGRASVTQTVESSGTVTAAHKAAPSFSVSGTVKSVKVKIGQKVTKGQALADLDTTSLQAAVDSANSTLATAEQRLEADKTGQTTTPSVAAGGTAQPSAYDPSTSLTARSAVYTATQNPATVTIESAGSTSTTTPSATNLTDLIKQVQSAQNAVIAAQQHVDSGQAGVDAAQKPVDHDVTHNNALADAQKTACATSGASTDSSSVTSNGLAISTACINAMADYEASAARLSTDIATLDTDIGVQDAYVRSLDATITALDKLITQLQSAASNAPTGSGGSPGSAGSNGSGSATGTGGSTGSGASAKSSGGSASTGQTGGSGVGSGQATSTPASAAQLAADQAAIDAANAQLALANQNLAAATLTSPISGNVAAIGFTVGASSSSQTITIVGAGVQSISTAVPLADVDLIKPGQSVSVAADGVASPLHGTVTSIGLLSSTSGSTTTFPVTVTLDAADTSLYDGTGADVVITTGTANNVITVPNSAIHAAARGSHTVTVLKANAPTTVPVILGVAGPDATQVTGGLKVGDQVVLADLSQALPGSTTSSNSRTGNFPPVTGGAGGIRNFAPGGAAGR